MIEQHDYDKLKQEEADEVRQIFEDELFKAIKPYIDGINNTIAIHTQITDMSKEECAEYVRDTLANLIEG